MSGNTTQNLLEDFDWRLAQFRPQVVFLMIGMNDCSTTRIISSEKFRSNFQQLCSKTADLNGCLTVLQTTCSSVAVSGEAPSVCDNVASSTSPLCPRCGGRMTIIAFLEKQDQAGAIQKILCHCGLWEDPPARASPSPAIV